MSGNDAEGAKNEHRRHSGESTRKLASIKKQQSQERQPANNESSFLELPKLSSSNIDNVESPKDDYFPPALACRKIYSGNSQRINRRGNSSSANRWPSKKYRSIETQTVEPDHFDDQMRRLARERSEPQVNRSHHFDDQMRPSERERSEPQVNRSHHFDDQMRRLERERSEPQLNRSHHFDDQMRRLERERSEPQVNRSHHFDDQMRRLESERSEPQVNRSRSHHFDDQMRHSVRERFEPLAIRSRQYDNQMEHSVIEGRVEPVANESHYKTIKPGTNKSFDYINPMRCLGRLNCFKPLANQIHHYYDDRIRHDYYGMPMSERFKPDFQPESIAKEYQKSYPYQRDEIGETVSRNFRMHATQNQRLERIEPNLGGRNESSGRKNYELGGSNEKKGRLEEEQHISKKEKKDREN